MKKSSLIIILIFAFVIVSYSVSAVEVNYCCEKTKTGAYCVNAPIEQCDVGVKNPSTGERYVASPTSCEATSYCQKGCCYDSDEGVCMMNVPQEACRAANGMWSDTPDCSIGQCKLGCCILGTEAAFVTLARCKKLSGYYGLQTNFDVSILDELSCIVKATSQDQGACVFEEDYVTTCKFTTRGECNAQISEGGLTKEDISFYKDRLCTDPALETDCARTRNTVCYGEKVYYVDTCGNRANIYDSARVNDIPYWTRVFSASESCQGNPRTCGNCEYLGSGTICKEGSGAQFGNNMCSDVNCYKTSNGKDYKNGESWCHYDDKTPLTDSVGSRHYVHTCFMGEEIVMPCADFRAEVCVEEKIGEGGDFSQAGCKTNNAKDCYLQDNIGDCMSGKRDCMWLPFDPKNPTASLGGTLGDISGFENIAGRLLNIRSEQTDIPGRCIPKIAPGLMFWETSAEDHCGVIDDSCTIKLTKKLYTDWECKENCFCDPSTSEGKMLAQAFAYYCSKIGDCGPGKNFVGKYTNKGYEIIIGKATKEPGDTSQATKDVESSGDYGGGQRQEFTSGTTGTGTAPTGNVIQGLIIESYNLARGK